MTEGTATATSKAAQSPLRDRLVTEIAARRSVTRVMDDGYTSLFQATSAELADAVLGIIQHDLESLEQQAGNAVAIAYRNAERAHAAEAERDQLRRADATVRALHQQYRDVFAVGDEDSCAHCNQISGTVIRWPCPTIAALDDPVELTPKPCPERAVHPAHTWEQYRREHHCSGNPTDTNAKEA